MVCYFVNLMSLFLKKFNEWEYLGQIFIPIHSYANSPYSSVHSASVS